MSEQSDVFLEIVTRTFMQRPNLLVANREALLAQTSDAWKQTLLVDYHRRGVIYANKAMRLFTPSGRYVWLLDDDDICIRPTLVQELQEIAQLNAPDVIFLRMDHGELGVLPDESQWGNRRLHHGHIGCSGFVVRDETWMAFRHNWGESYHGDFEFISAVAADKQVRVYWHDVIASRVQRISRGASEEEMAVRYKANRDVRVLVSGRVAAMTAGQVYELLPQDAVELVRAGFVTPIVPEVAAVAPSERAVAPKSKAKRAK